MNPRFNGDQSLAFRSCSAIYDIKYVLQTTTNLNLTCALLDDFLSKMSKELTDDEYEHYVSDNTYRGKIKTNQKEILDSIVND